MPAACRCHTDLLTANVRESIALLDAILIGGLLRRTTAGDDAKHAAAVALLEVIHKRLRDGVATMDAATAERHRIDHRLATARCLG